VVVQAPVNPQPGSAFSRYVVPAVESPSAGASNSPRLGASSNTPHRRSGRLVSGKKQEREGVEPSDMDLAVPGLDLYRDL
jgi:hypothetical protein